ncbi:ketoacyl-ACP synthase III [Erysipelothrix sp. HDW6C]|uniref:beta-ketoacyl-ACP synthase III n=1 Tax=Erysipelothrix sp. HDW6C TaxID=2714930 RepID=UPI00140BC43F|nr:beta-ketoacyl-ACP synthase III [Erysipelothrix sp. HDW6C]QIK69712.1 ketoacyl-ACP synthase III [Erysipelothrix sp. HDW6C]
MKSSIISTGSYRPKQVVSNFDFEGIMETSDAWIVQRTGIRQRLFEDESSVRMATEAARNALENLDASSIDCIIVATYTPDSFIPTIANQVRAHLGITNPIPSFDINAACSGFVYAYQTAHAYIASGIYKRILVVGVDFNSRYLDFSDRATSILFGDGAGAIVMEAGITGSIDCILGGETDTLETIRMQNMSDHGNPFVSRPLTDSSYFEMKGAEVFKFAVRVMESSVHAILERNKLTSEDVDLVISHQANQRILDSGARALKMPKEKFLSNVAEVGNTSSASVPLLLDEANRKGQLKPGMKIILVAFGGGLTYGTALLEWVA